MIDKHSNETLHAWRQKKVERVK